MNTIVRIIAHASSCTAASRISISTLISPGIVALRIFVVSAIAATIQVAIRISIWLRAKSLNRSSSRSRKQNSRCCTRCRNQVVDVDAPHDNWKLELAAAKLDDPAHALFHVDASWTIRLMLYFI